MVVIQVKTFVTLRNIAKPQLGCDMTFFHFPGAGQLKSVRVFTGDLSQRAQLLLIQRLPITAPIHWYLCDISM